MLRSAIWQQTILVILVNLTMQLFKYFQKRDNLWILDCGQITAQINQAFCKYKK